MLVVLKYYLLKKKLCFNANTRYSVSLKSKLAVLGRNLKENNCVEQQNTSAPLDGIDISKAVDKTMLEVLAKLGEAKSNKELEFFQRHGHSCFKGSGLLSRFIPLNLFLTPCSPLLIPGILAVARIRPK